MRKPWLRMWHLRQLRRHQLQRHALPWPLSRGTRPHSLLAHLPLPCKYLARPTDGTPFPPHSPTLSACHLPPLPLPPRKYLPRPDRTPFPPRSPPIIRIHIMHYILPTGLMAISPPITRAGHSRIEYNYFCLSYLGEM